MPENIGGKIQMLAVVTKFIGYIASLLAGILVLASNVLLGLCIIGLGCLFSWLGSLLLLGFGELIEYVEQIAHNTKPGVPAAAERKKYLSNIATTKKTCPICDCQVDQSATTCPHCGQSLS